MKLQKLHPDPLRSGIHRCGLGVDEQPYRAHKGRQTSGEGSRNVGGDVAGAPWVEDETDRIGAGLDGGIDILRPGQAADLYAGSPFLVSNACRRVSALSGWLVGRPHFAS